METTELEETKRLRLALAEAVEDMRDMRSYVPDYFAEKWGHDEAIAKATAAVLANGCPLCLDFAEDIRRDHICTQETVMETRELTERKTS